MPATLVLVIHSLKRMRAVLIALALMLAAFEFLLTQVGDYLLRRSAFPQLALLLPDFVRSVVGPSTLALMSFSGIVGLGYFHPVVLASLIGVTIAIATEPAGEVETRFVDLTLARPVTRTHLLTRTILVLVVAGAALLAAMTAATSTGLACCTSASAPRIQPRVIGSLVAYLAGVMTCWAGIALAIAAGARRRAAAGAAAAACAFAAYLLDYLGRAWQPAASASVLSPFHYFEPMAVIGGQSLDVRDLATLGAIGAAGIVCAYVLFLRRDI